MHFSINRKRETIKLIERCCAQLSEEQMRHRGGDHENSIVNLLLHLEGNIRQWALHGVGGAEDVRRRDAEFALALDVTGAEALARLQATVAEARAVIASVDAQRLLEVVDPQPGRVAPGTVLAAIARIFGHLEHHTGQIIVLTKQAVAHDLDLSLPRER